MPCAPAVCKHLPGGSLHMDLLGAGGALLATLSRRDLEQAVRRGCPEHLGGDCRCPVVTRPPQSPGYVPTAAQRRWVAARDGTCRHPGCRNKAGWADLDHVVAHAEGGPTDCDNLCCLCRRHHRLKTHAPGWAFRLDSDGALLVTTPSGVTRSADLPASASWSPTSWEHRLRVLRSSTSCRSERQVGERRCRRAGRTVRPNTFR